MKLTEKQMLGIRDHLFSLLEGIFSDAHDRTEVVEEILPGVCSDVESTADWSDYEDDEYNIGDIEIAAARVIKNKICN